jgi:DNA-binding transcriptional regulator YiaG
MQRAVDLMYRAHMEVASDIPLGLETAYRVANHLRVPVDPLEIISVSDTAVPRLIDELHAARYGDRKLPEHVWRHGAYTGLVAAQHRYKIAANSGLPPAFCEFFAANVSARRVDTAKSSPAVLNAADITARLSHSLYTARTEAGLSQERLADQVTGVRPDQIGRWENGRVRISERKLLLFVDFFPYDLAWWFADHRNGNGP